MENKTAEPTIKSVTNCPTCGAECEVHGNATHYYVPISVIKLRRIEDLEKDIQELKSELARYEIHDLKRKQSLNK